MNVTHDVVSDLWPLYASGEASADTRALVDAFLAGDPAFAQALRDSGEMKLPADAGPHLPPDHEMTTLVRIRKRLSGYILLLQFAMMFSCFAFARIISDTSWDVSPRNFIVVASIAAAFWIAFCVTLWRNRARILIVRGAARAKKGRS
jgi:peptidoglycan/LPS O-acetylase OafA/YrhL